MKKKKNKLITFLRENSGDVDLFNKNFNEKNGLFYSDKNFFNYMSIYFSPKDAFIGMDASASTFQIQGLLLGDDLMLRLTNVFPSEKKEDIYIYIMEKLYDTIKEDEKLNFYWNEINEKEKYNLFENEIEFKDFIFKLLKDRKIWKSLIMKLGYNQGRSERSEDLYDYIVENYYKILKKRKIKFLQFTFWLSGELEKVFYKIFPKQKLLRKFMWKLVSILYKENKGVYFSLKGYHKVKQFYYKKEYKEIWSTSWVNKKKKIILDLLHLIMKN